VKEAGGVEVELWGTASSALAAEGEAA
jgi:hypothetical protein